MFGESSTRTEFDPAATLIVRSLQLQLAYQALIKNAHGEKELPEINIRNSYKHPKVNWGIKERFPMVKDFPWVDV